MIPLLKITPVTSLIGFMIGFPTTLATYYQAWKARQEGREARLGMLSSQDCLEFNLPNGETVNLVPLGTLHSLPKPGDIVLLPGTGRGETTSAFRVDRIEHIYARMEGPASQMRGRALGCPARLVKTVAQVDALG